jgi:Flp pilus assembly protein TadB
LYIEIWRVLGQNLPWFISRNCSRFYMLCPRYEPYAFKTQVNNFATPGILLSTNPLYAAAAAAAAAVVVVVVVAAAAAAAVVVVVVYSTISCRFITQTLLEFCWT